MSGSRRCPGSDSSGASWLLQQQSRQQQEWQGLWRVFSDSLQQGQQHMTSRHETSTAIVAPVPTIAPMLKGFRICLFTISLSTVKACSRIALTLPGAVFEAAVVVVHLAVEETAAVAAAAVAAAAVATKAAAGTVAAGTAAAGTALAEEDKEDKVLEEEDTALAEEEEEVLAEEEDEVPAEEDEVLAEEDGGMAQLQASGPVGDRCLCIVTRRESNICCSKMQLGTSAQRHACLLALV
eukprot:CAMPEP_0119302318 /NCGR_PEP_ID=MMETSP1333-20130426/3930_1 /TAXON_ID=418940 /ORGANISM="Scyphosphaera apsteinii, Strain RCC1455" /LENGTH=237 /DNA_ID=CAMNT_0007304633 /DNA_START=746 /DNA_END=1461 /DNA_ORIENTATION=-